MKTWVCHDYFALSGGGENLMATLAAELQLPLSGGFVKQNLSLSNDFPLQSIHSLGAYQGVMPLQILSLIRRWRRFKAPSDYPKILYSGVYSPLAVHNHSGCKNILYCHTPPRFVYDKKAYYLQQLAFWQRPLLRALIAFFQPQYERALQQMDGIIVNSKHIQQRLQKYTGVSSTVIYPPCDTQDFVTSDNGEYYLSTARLDGLKRVDKIVRAFLHMPDKKLVVASGGPELARLQGMAGNARNIHFTGWVSREQLITLVAGAMATIYIPMDEDFGISPLESMAAGKPVIGVNEGGLLETVIPLHTGVLLDARQDIVEQLIRLINSANSEQWRDYKPACLQQAERFSRDVFIRKMSAYLEQI